VRDTIIVHDTVYIDKCDSSRTPKGLEMVDLGLSVKWANMNIGATKPEEYGDYFAWGETSPKTDYSWSTYTYCKGTDNSLTKYCVGSYYGTVDSITTLEAADDAAHVNWGGNWRMPTQAEQEELYTNCTMTWTTNYQGTGIAGRIFTSNKTGYTDQSIFLPAAGYFGGTTLLDVGSSGQYRSSSLYTISSTYAWSLLLQSNYGNASYGYRYYGRSVRAVCP